MNKYIVTLELMVDPVNGDETIKQKYTIDAENKRQAYILATEKQDNDKPEIRYLSVFDYTVKQV